MPVRRGTLTARYGIHRIYYQIKSDPAWAQQAADVPCISWPYHTDLIPLGARVDLVVRSRPPEAAQLVDIVGAWKWEGVDTVGVRRRERPAGLEWRVVGSHGSLTEYQLDGEELGQGGVLGVADSIISWSTV